MKIMSKRTKLGKQAFVQRKNCWCSALSMSLTLTLLQPIVASAQGVPSPLPTIPSSSHPTSSAVTTGHSNMTLTGIGHAPVVPSATLSASTINSILANTTNASTNSGNLVVDVSKLPGGILSFGNNQSFVNYGNLLLVSSSALTKTATLQASSIFNAPGASITSVLPAGGGTRIQQPH